MALNSKELHASQERSFFYWKILGLALKVMGYYEIQFHSGLHNRYWEFNCGLDIVRL